MSLWREATNFKEAYGVNYNNVNLTVTKEFTWDMAHMLAGHEGLCKNLHGHTYKMHVTVTRIGTNESGTPWVRKEGPAEGMVVDFKELKEVVEKLIVHPLDHCFMFWQHSSDMCEHELCEVLSRHGKKIAWVEYRPTAENMVADFFSRIQAETVQLNLPWTVTRVQVWETPTSYASFGM